MGIPAGESDVHMHAYVSRAQLMHICICMHPFLFTGVVHKHVRVHFRLQYAPGNECVACAAAAQAPWYAHAQSSIAIAKANLAMPVFLRLGRDPGFLLLFSSIPHLLPHTLDILLCY